MRDLKTMNVSRFLGLARSIAILVGLVLASAIASDGARAAILASSKPAGESVLPIDHYRVVGARSGFSDDPHLSGAAAKRPRFADVGADDLNPPMQNTQNSDDSSRPNVVVILADDFGWADVETNNPDSPMTTPNIDGIASAGANFTDAHSPSAMCSPTRYGLLTGRYAWRTWLKEGVLGGSSRPMIEQGRPTIGTLLQDNGYYTGAIGKWHLGLEYPTKADIGEIRSRNRGIDYAADLLDGPLDHGFDEFFGTAANLAWQPHIYIRDRRFVADPDPEYTYPSKIYSYERVLDRLTEEAIDFIDRQAETEDPFFLYMPLHAIHVPFEPNAQFDGFSGFGAYGDVVAQMDWSIGQVLDALDESGVSDDTLVVFASDNGSGSYSMVVGDGPRHKPNGHFRGAKGTIFEGGHRVPLMMRWPGEIEAGTQIDAAVSLTDLYATITEILGDELDTATIPDSKSLLPLLEGDSDERGYPIVHHSGNGMYALRDGRWKLVFGNGSGHAEANNRGAPWSTPWMLFDLETDPREQESVAAANPELMEQMEAKLDEIRAAEDETLSSDATLSRLTVAGTAVEPIDGRTRAFEAFVPADVTRVYVSAIPNATDAVVDIASPSGVNTHGRPTVRLDGYTTNVQIVVKPPDESAQNVYSLAVKRTLSISGKARVFRVLTADTSGLTQSFGLPRWRFSYQWLREEEGQLVEIDGATDRTYEVTSSDVGRRLAVLATFPSSDDETQSFVSLKTSTVQLPSIEITALDETDVTPQMSGFSRYGRRGSISPNGWQVRDTLYTPSYLWHTGVSLVLGFNRPPPSDFTLHLGGKSYRASESLVPRTLTETGYWWPSSTQDWTSGEPFEVRMTLHQDAAIGEREKAPVTGHFAQYPTEHDGRIDLKFRIYFNDGVDATAEDMKNDILSVTGGTVSWVERVDSEGRIWTVSVMPSNRLEPVSVRIESDLDCVATGAVCSSDGRRLYHDMALTVSMRQNNVARGLPVINGDVEVGSTLTVDLSGISDADGIPEEGVEYQWFRNVGGPLVAIPGEIEPSYTVTEADVDTPLRVQVRYTDDWDFEESLLSKAAVWDRPHSLTAEMSDVGVQLRWKRATGVPNAGMYRILRHRPELGEPDPLVHVEFTLDASTEYTDRSVEPGVLYVYRVQNIDLFGYAGDPSVPASVRVPDQNYPARGEPTISGAAFVGETLTADVSGIDDVNGISGAEFSYQWIADGVEIEGATGESYTLSAEEDGKSVMVRVSFADDRGNAESLISAATDTVAIPLTARFLDTPSNHQGQGRFTFELRFSEEISVSWSMLRDNAFIISGGEIRNARRLERNSATPNIRWEITVIPDGGGDVSIVLPATEDCDAAGAICASDGRMLFKRNELTVVGPDG